MNEDDQNRPIRGDDDVQGHMPVKWGAQGDDTEGDDTEGHGMAWSDRSIKDNVEPVVHDEDSQDTEGHARRNG